MIKTVKNFPSLVLLLLLCACFFPGENRSSTKELWYRNRSNKYKYKSRLLHSHNREYFAFRWCTRMNTRTTTVFLYTSSFGSQYTYMHKYMHVVRVQQKIQHKLLNVYNFSIFLSLLVTSRNLYGFSQNVCAVKSTNVSEKSTVFRV